MSEDAVIMAGVAKLEAGALGNFYARAPRAYQLLRVYSHRTQPLLLRSLKIGQEELLNADTGIPLWLVSELRPTPTVMARQDVWAVVELCGKRSRNVALFFGGVWL